MIPTPTAGDAKSSGSRNTEESSAHPGLSLTDFVRGDLGEGRMWPTPQARDGDRRGAIAERFLNPERSNDLPDAIAASRMWPTPDVGAAKGRGQASANGRGRLGGSLSPMWVEWLQGYPEGWTDLER